MSHSTHRAPAGAAGFSLIELMIGMAIGLLCTLVIASVLTAAEGNRRGTTSGSDAQIAGNLALYALQTEMGAAGYGFASESNAVGCALSAQFNGAPAAALPPVLAPVTITAGPAQGSDTVRVLASSKTIDVNAATFSNVGFTVPQRVITPFYTPGMQTVNVRSIVSYTVGDLVVLVTSPGQPCELFQVTGLPAAGAAPQLVRADQPPWNSVGFPTSTAYAPCTLQLGCEGGAPFNPAGAFVVNLGRILDRQFTVVDDRLVLSELNSTTLDRAERDLQSGVVMMKAYYGHDTDADGAVDRYDKVTPINQVGWQSVLSVKVAVVARAGQYERDEVTTAGPLWRVGSAAAVDGSIECGDSRCIQLDLSALPDWKHYRYKVYDTVVALRNQRYKSGMLRAAPAGSAASGV